eukprot:4107512-Prymnesium_polylepis.2
MTANANLAHPYLVGETFCFAIFVSQACDATSKFGDVGSGERAARISLVVKPAASSRALRRW